MSIPAWIESIIRDTIHRSEGGFQDDPVDKGNWTGGAIGKGKLKGTKYGISAATYPHLNIKALTLDDAINIYWNEWWQGPLKWLQALRLPIVAAKLFDLGITMGPERLAVLAQQACNAMGEKLVVDGKAGPLTVAAINRCGERFLVVFKNEAHEFYEWLAWKDPRKRRFLDGWINRVYA